ncbi:hypothetical protein [Labilithrix luteola]|nr:hypothetical protein [Labilithrix luteola]
MSDLTPSAKMLERLRPAFGPSDAARERMRAGVLARAAEATSSPPSDATVPRPPASGVRLALRAHASKLLGGVLVLLAAGGVTTYASTGLHRSDPPASVVAPPPKAEGCPLPACASVPASQPDVHEPATSSLATLGSPYELPDARDRRAVSAPATRASAVLAHDSDAPVQLGERTDDSLDKEVRYLREGQRALRAGDLERARRSVDAHANEFPRGLLRGERLVLDVLLLCAEGRTERARRAAEAVVREDPLSSHLEPLRASCAGIAVP